MARETPVEAEFSVPGSVSDQWPSAGVVEFENVWMKYRPELSPSLLGLTFKTGPREKIGICGRTGAGKSTSSATDCFVFAGAPRVLHCFSFPPHVLTGRFLLSCGRHLCVYS
jgi:hypothetical protein